MQRENIVNDFRAGKTWVLIATDVIARGMDFKGVNCVINYDFPYSAAAYIHRIGMLHNLLLHLVRDLDFSNRLPCPYFFVWLLKQSLWISQIGRSGRAGRSGEAITFYTEDDVPFLRNIANVMAGSGCEVPSWIMALRKLRWKKHRPKRESISTKPNEAED